MDKQQIPAGYKQTEVGVIPENWQTKKLGEIGQFKNGINKDASSFGHGTPFVNLMDVFGKPSISGLEEFGLLDATENDLKEYALVRGDVLFIRSSVKPSGVGLTSVIKSKLVNTVYSGFLIRYRSNDQLAVAYKEHCFYQSDFRKRIIAASSVSANTNINQDSLKDITLVVPPLKEQTAIANALSDVDILITALEKLIDKKTAIKTATMQQLLTGKKRLPPFDQLDAGYKQTEVGEIPKDWEVKSLSGLANIQRGASPRPIESPIWFDRASTVGWLRISDVSKANKYLFATTQNLSPLGIQNSRYVASGNLVMSICATVGRPILTRKNLCIHDGFVVFNKLQASIDFTYYLLSFIENDWGKQGQTGSQMNLNSDLINTTLVRLPTSLEEQNSIANVLSDMDSELNALQQRLAKTQHIKQGMMQELLTGKTRLVTV